MGHYTHSAVWGGFRGPCGDIASYICIWSYMYVCIFVLLKVHMVLGMYMRMYILYVLALAGITVQSNPGSVFFLV